MKAATLNMIIILITILTACQRKEPIIPYEEALKICIPDTMMHIMMDGDTSWDLPLNPDCIRGAQLPWFTATTMDGEKIDSVYYEDHVTVINFWFIGCKPCEEEMPGFNEIVKEYAGKPVNFLAISNNSPKHITEFLLEHPFNFKHVAYGEQIYRSNFQARWGYPMTLIVDDRMKIVKVFYRGMMGRDDEIVDAIENELSLL